MKQLARLMSKTQTSEESPRQKIGKLLGKMKSSHESAPAVGENLEESAEHEAAETTAEEYLEELLAGKAKNKSGIKFRSQTGGQKNQDLLKFGAGNDKGPIA